MILIMYSIQIN